MQLPNEVNGHTCHKKAHDHEDGIGRPLPVFGREVAYFKNPFTGLHKQISDAAQKHIHGGAKFDHEF